jgi:hypothetical protein
LLERYGRGPSERFTRADGRVVDRVVVGSNADSRREALAVMLDDAHARRAAIEKLNKGTSPQIQERITRLGWKAQAARLEAQRTESVGVAGAGLCVGTRAAGFGWLSRGFGCHRASCSALAHSSGKRSTLLLTNALRVLGLVGATVCCARAPVERRVRCRPNDWTGPLASIEERRADLQDQQAAVLLQLDEMRVVDSAFACGLSIRGPPLCTRVASRLQMNRCCCRHRADGQAKRDGHP